MKNVKKTDIINQKKDDHYWNIRANIAHKITLNVREYLYY